MKIAQVIKLSPMERLLYWIRERESIRLKKEEGEPKPWTDDEILQRYRFCNVRRMDDKVSQWLLTNWYRLYFDHPNMLVACTLARQLNNTKALEGIGFPCKWKPTYVEEILNSRTAAGLNNYSAAYMITSSYGPRGRTKQTKVYQTVHTVCQPVYESQLSLDTKCMKNLWQSLLSFPGFSSFIAGQVVADLRWALRGSWSDRMSWAAVGPGSQRGLNRLKCQPLKTHWCQDEFLPSLRWLIAQCQNELSKNIISRLEAIDYQSCLCEFDKYDRVLQGQGVPRRKYPGGSG